MNDLDDLAKIRWRCRRGMLELDLILEPFFDSHYQQLNEAQQAAFRQLLRQDDPSLYAWLMGFSNPVEAELISLVSFIRQHRNKN